MQVCLGRVVPPGSASPHLLPWFSNSQKPGISSGSLLARGQGQGVLMDSDTRAFPHGGSNTFSMENQSTVTK